MDEQVEVETPAGSSLKVMEESEARYYDSLAQRYQRDNLFENVSDKQDLDRVLLMELLVYRWANWLSTGVDYWGSPIDDEAAKKGINDTSKELRLLKKSMGIDKATRDKERGLSPVEYLTNLRRRAMELGVHRNEQATTAITLFQELRALFQLYENCTIEERREQNCELEDIVEWLNQIAFPEFEKLDQVFRKKQTIWVKDL